MIILHDKIQFNFVYYTRVRASFTQLCSKMGKTTLIAQQQQKNGIQKHRSTDFEAVGL